MEFETIKEKIETYMQNNNITYLRKSQLADFAIKNNYELEDINALFSYDSANITSFTEKINGMKYTRYVIGRLTCEQIMEQTHLQKCYCCSCYTASTIDTEDGKHFCCDDCAHYYGYYTCSECGKITKCIYSYNRTHLCKNCADTKADNYGIQKCTRCGEYYKKERLYKASNKYFCSNCVDSLNLIYGYHGHGRNNLWKPRKNNREKNNYFGYENEFEIKSNTPRNAVALGINELLKENHIDGFFVYESDGSLNTGFEAISQPSTLAWLYENEKNLQPIYDFLTSCGCTAEKTTTAGLHIHFSRTALTKDYSLAKLAYLINKLQYDIVKYSGRKLNELSYTHFDSFYNRDGEIRLADYKAEYGMNNKSSNTNHSAIVNRQHGSTIEIRIFKGTLDLKRIIANIELVNNLVYYVENRTDEQCENVTFKELCLYKKTRYLKEFYYKIFEPNTKLKSKAVKK